MKTRSHSRSKSANSKKSDNTKPNKNKIQKPRGTSRSKSRGKEKNPTKKCGLCGKTKKLFKTECCSNWICDDYDNYVMFSYSNVSCHRNHDRYTLCSFHFIQGHKGYWQDCKECIKDIEPEMYVWYGTNENNFEKLKNVPIYEPTKCNKCQRVIKLGTEPHQTYLGEYTCFHCLAIDGKLF